MPADPEAIQQDVLDLLADGETVLQFKSGDTQYHILWRKSMLKPLDETYADSITMADLSSEMFGLSTLWVHPDFYPSMTNHFDKVSHLFT